MKEKFRYQKFIEPKKGSSIEFCKNVRKKIHQTRDTLPPLLSMDSFDTRKNLKHRRVPLWNFPALWDKKRFDRPSWNLPLLSTNVSETGKFLYYRRFPSRIFCFGPVRQKNSTKPWCSPSLIWIFLIPEFSWNTKWFDYEVFQYCEKKFSPKLW